MNAVIQAVNVVQAYMLADLAEQRGERNKARRLRKMATDAERVFRAKYSAAPAPRSEQEGT
jgi:hypothetical protein